MQKGEIKSYKFKPLNLKVCLLHQLLLVLLDMLVWPGRQAGHGWLKGYAFIWGNTPIPPSLELNYLV